MVLCMMEKAVGLGEPSAKRGLVNSNYSCLVNLYYVPDVVLRTLYKLHLVLTVALIDSIDFFLLRMKKLRLREGNQLPRITQPINSRFYLYLTPNPLC